MNQIITIPDFFNDDDDDDERNAPKKEMKIKTMVVEEEEREKTFQFLPGVNLGWLVTLFIIGGRKKLWTENDPIHHIKGFISDQDKKSFSFFAIENS
ncbi:hypothetical protein DERF_006611 [Dermatophagoides farinae]|uniref:Uncharacterized protein n=1 Tax=Dermatophagoides farinae TaxID=6954 RepID=A0A922I0I2_DERFA|nr:hypothetical protein DERF_006611 [Dermatophagoides farinae]